jgi:hypothetical protein
MISKRRHNQLSTLTEQALTRIKRRMKNLCRRGAEEAEKRAKQRLCALCGKNLLSLNLAGRKKAHYSCAFRSLFMPEAA